MTPDGESSQLCILKCVLMLLWVEQKPCLLYEKPLERPLAEYSNFQVKELLLKHKVLSFLPHSFSTRHNVFNLLFNVILSKGKLKF